MSSKVQVQPLTALSVTNEGKVLQSTFSATLDFFTKNRSVPLALSKFLSPGDCIIRRFLSPAVIMIIPHFCLLSGSSSTIHVNRVTVKITTKQHASQTGNIHLYAEVSANNIFAAFLNNVYSLNAIKKLPCLDNSPDTLLRC